MTPTEQDKMNEIEESLQKVLTLSNVFAILKTVKKGSNKK